MSKRCELTGVAPRYGNTVSHSKRHTRRRWEPNLQTRRIYIPEEGRYVTVRATAAAIKTLSKKGLKSVEKMRARVARRRSA